MYFPVPLKPATLIRRYKRFLAEMLAYQAAVTPESIDIVRSLPVILNNN